MSVLINGMKMPKDGFITITVTSDGRVVGNAKKESGKYEYLGNEDIAKAIPVPPHGRLIDANALTYLMGMDEHFSPLEAMYLMELIADAPTIIPADKEGEG